MKGQETYGLPQHAIEKINSIFRNYPAIKKVVIYGSRAKGNYRPGSDIDLCIEAEQLNITELLKIENLLDDLMLPWKIDLSHKDKIDNTQLLEHINRVGLEFYHP